MRTIIQLISSLNEVAGKVASVFNLLLVAVVCMDVIVRYLIKQSSAAFYELEWHMFAFIFLISAGWTLRHERHVRVDIFYAKASPRVQAVIDVCGVLLLLLPFSLTLISTGLPYALVAFESGEGSPDTGGLPFRWIVKSFIVIGTGLLILQGVAMLLEKILFLIEGKEREGKERSEDVA
ncbi:MAG: TRAP transporter small permease subunit [Chloroherpetonaceae bacterium]